ncbi:MAG: diguanylate cyclase [Thermodesulfobacteriota bacterium]
MQPQLIFQPIMENQSSEYLKKLAKVSIDILKELAAKGSELSAETLFKAYESNEDIQRLRQDPAEKPAAAATPPAESAPSTQLADLKSQIEKHQVQKDQLIKQINLLESKQTESETFYKRGLLFVIRLLETRKEGEVGTTMVELQELLAGNTEQSRIATAFHRFKDAALKEGIDPPIQTAPPSPKKASFLARLFASREEGAPQNKEQTRDSRLPQIVDAYQDIIDELKLKMGQQYLEALLRIERRLLKSKTVSELSLVGKDIFEQIQQFIDHVGAERELALGFIREISQRLLEVEKHVVNSIDQTSRIYRSNQDFSNSLESHLGDLRTNIDYSQTLIELKESLVVRLNTINTIISAKKEQDGKSKTEADRQLENLRQSMDQMKNQIQAAEERASSLEQELLRDPLTGAYNRRAYDRRIIEELHRYLRYQTIFSLLLFDVDHFKRINDTYGHTVGDKCLKEIIARITMMLRKCDFPARYGGEEFVLILPETSCEQGRSVGEKIRQLVEKIDFIHKGDTIRITVSVGVTQVAPDDKDPETIFTRLDQAMYAAKNSGRNTVVVT